MTADRSSQAPSTRRPSFVQRYLDPIDGMGEFLFGLIMVLTFTLGAGLVVDEGPDATKQMLLGIIGCNIAWGLIDGGMYIMSSVFERSGKERLLESIQTATSRPDALAMVGKALDDRLEPLTTASEREHIYGMVYNRLKHLKPERTRLTRDDVFGAFACFWLVFISTIPAVLPFLIFPDRLVALRVSNALLLAMLFGVGYRWARFTHSNPWVVGSSLVAVGLTMVAIAMAFGG